MLVREVQEKPFKRVDSLQDMERLEEMSKDPTFVKQCTKYFYGKHGASGDGESIAFSIMDEMLDRKFMTKCSWTGQSRAKVTEGEKAAFEVKNDKIKFKDFVNFLDMFFTCVRSIDKSIKIEAVAHFFQVRTRNAKQRDGSKQQRVSVTRRPRKNKKGSDIGDRSNDDANSIGEFEIQPQSNNQGDSVNAIGQMKIGAGPQQQQTSDAERSGSENVATVTVLQNLQQPQQENAVLDAN